MRAVLTFIFAGFENIFVGNFTLTLKAVDCFLEISGSNLDTTQATIKSGISFFVEYI
jgi:hypothetical protein